MASADALIGCWNNKKIWYAWRPDGDPRGGERRQSAHLARPGLAVALRAPGYPDEPSGYNCYTGGFWNSARLFFGTDKYSFSLTSPGVPANAAAGNPVGVAGSTRTYKRFTGRHQDTIDGRILNGFHFRTADVHGAWIGKKAAQWIDKHYFEAVD